VLGVSGSTPIHPPLCRSAPPEGASWLLPHERTCNDHRRESPTSCEPLAASPPIRGPRASRGVCRLGEPPRHPRHVGAYCHGGGHLRDGGGGPSLCVPVGVRPRW